MLVLGGEGFWRRWGQPCLCVWSSRKGLLEVPQHVHWTVPQANDLVKGGIECRDQRLGILYPSRGKPPASLCNTSSPSWPLREATSSLLLRPLCLRPQKSLEIGAVESVCLLASCQHLWPGAISKLLQPCSCSKCTSPASYFSAASFPCLLIPIPQATLFPLHLISPGCTFPHYPIFSMPHFPTTPFPCHLTASPAPPSCASTFLVGCLRNELGEDSSEPPWPWLEFTGYSYMWPVGSSYAELYHPGFCSHWGHHQEHLYPKLFSVCSHWCSPGQGLQMLLKFLPLTSLYCPESMGGSSRMPQCSPMVASLGPRWWGRMSFSWPEDWGSRKLFSDRSSFK